MTTNEYERRDARDRKVDWVASIIKSDPAARRMAEASAQRIARAVLCAIDPPAQS